MTIVSSGRLESFERRTPTMFLISGLLFLFAALGFTAGMTTPMSLVEVLSGPPLVVGILLSYVAMIGLYFRLADRTRLALIGILLLVAPFLTNLLLIFVYAPLTGTVPQEVEILISVLWGTIGTGSAVMGVGILRTDGFSSVLGLALFGWAVIWFGIGLAGFIYGAQHPAWVDLGISGVGGASLMIVGYRLRENPFQPGRTKRAEEAV